MSCWEGCIRKIYRRYYMSRFLAGLSTGTQQPVINSKHDEIPARYQSRNDRFLHLYLPIPDRGFVRFGLDN